MVLWLIGLGLYDENDITLRGLQAVRKCSRVYLEAYTSILLCNKEKLEELYGREVIVADREMVESEAERILKDADKEDVAFLVVGDPFGATTHTDLQLRARQQGIPVKVVHNASVMNAVGACGLQLYRFGESISIVFFTDTWRPDSFYDRIRDNRRAGVHTLCLLDIKVKEPNLEKLARGRVVYEPPRYMSVNTAVEQLLEVESRRGEGAYGPDTLAIGIARLQADDQLIVAAPMSELKGIDFGAPLHSLVIAGSVHVMEEEMIECFRIRNQPGLKPYTPQLAASDDESGL
uniref:diphthine methyl ester synthase n=2 Tax=Dunaliella tertiolecta TaxID=3047 RepID=A0A7S3QKH8_DUNTE|mmetsp:Transcript_14029/g.37900  ORF Transcript_14029/g.37900 Transcript_14029/m.37900 type:complete len:291 (-) Transcript_14029:293-1165(-)|eukprot:CAMPEP_0202348284 /NCGR_PEP_ID=MMETSP1126-20121109/6281_1 /ASSEMBLY_ACC=CAM_ASM_000457 /TAXON_ID=3047 /ORGANISM="Dunaliella tertiolecta, Strain CCMP1320" /LENGTH=290 /DNA_ID=CAMNT_0048939951 /DNA_START=71 /DNA_END=943 /DNA_ORIENTATION=-